MTMAVTDVRGTTEHQIQAAAEAIGRSAQRRVVFVEIHRGKKRIKTATEIADATGLPRKRVLEEAVKLVHKQIISKAQRDGDTAYERDDFYYAHRTEILRRADGLKRGGGGPQPLYATRVPTPKARAHRPKPNGKKTAPTYDTFLSHASEDKADIARPLYGALKEAGVTVWFDEAVLTLGDNLRRKLDDGLARCRFGIVILSPSFFSKDWPQRELDGLVARENASGQKTILPVWHRLTKSEVATYSPMLADRLAANSTEGIPALVRKIKAALAASP
jgi:hypothetical protein